MAPSLSASVAILLMAGVLPSVVAAFGFLPRSSPLSPLPSSLGGVCDISLVGVGAGGRGSGGTAGGRSSSSYIAINDGRGCNSHVSVGRRHGSGAGSIVLASASDDEAGGNDDDGNEDMARIESWLITYLPSLPPGDLKGYAANFFEGGYTTLDKLNSIAYKDGGGVDVEFMKRGHRRVLLKKIRESNVEAEPPLEEKGEVSESTPSADNQDEVQTSPSADQQQMTLDEVEELERVISQKRAERLVEEKELEVMLEKAKNALKDSGGAVDDGESNPGEEESRPGEGEHPASRSPSTGYNSEGNATQAENGAQEDHPTDDYFDITQNLFPEDNIRRGRSLFRSLTTSASLSPPNAPAFRREELSEMNDRRPPMEQGGGSNDYDALPEEKRPTRSLSKSWEPFGFRAEDKSEMKSASASASALYRKLRSSSKLPSSKTEQRQTPPLPLPPSFKASPNRASSAGKPKTTSLTNATPSIKADDDNGASTKRRKQPRQPQDEDQSYLDITSRFPEDERPSSLVNTGTVSRKDPPPRRFNVPRGRENEKRRFDDSFRVDDECDDTGVDITRQHFPKERPMALVNTGTLKDGTTSGTYADSKRSLGKENGALNDDDDDGGYVDITRQHFSEDRGSFVLRVNSGTKKRGTTLGSGYDEQTDILENEKKDGISRNIAQRFSHDRKSLMGHPSPKKPASKDVTQNHYLDVHRFSSPPDLAPASRIVTTRADSSSVKHEKYLDTPRVFKDIDMVRNAPSLTSSAAERDNELGESKNKSRRITEADKFLDTNQFSWNLSPSTKNFASGSAAVTKGPASSGQKEQQYLDEYGPFQSRVDTRSPLDRSSNLSGAKFKRSSDIPPELKEENQKDYYDITRTPMSSVVDMGGEKVVRRGVVDDDEYLDVSKLPLAPLQRASSAVKDANTAASRVRSETPSNKDDDDSFSSYEDVMCWLLTHLPQLREEDAILYFNHLLEDGFDSIDMLNDALEEDDLYFMKTGHQRALLRSVLDEELLDNDSDANT